jgi:GH15 family glucan-1,4-alpha-glucosidase
VSEPEDIFFIPIVIDVESLAVKSTLSKKEKRDLLARLEQQSNKDIAEQVRVDKPSPAHNAPLAFSNTRYLDYVSKVKKQIKELLERK